MINPKMHHLIHIKIIWFSILEMEKNSYKRDNNNESRSVARFEMSIR